MVKYQLSSLFFGWYKIKSYLRFLLRSTNEHGVHSPFVFDLLTKCFYKKTDKDLIKHLDLFKKTPVNIGFISRKQLLLLMNLVRYKKFQKILQIGTPLGAENSCIAMASPDASITTLEDNFSDILSKTGKNYQYDLICFNNFFSKNHLLQYFYQAIASIHNETVFVVKNIHANPDCWSAWEEMKSAPRVKVTIDTFYCGLVFFRKEQEKEHFTIRI